TILDAGAGDAEVGGLFDFGDENFAEVWVWIEHQEMIGWLQAQPMAHTVLNLRQRETLAAGDFQKLDDEVIEIELRFERGLGFERAHVDATTRAQLDPTLLGQFTIGGADRVGMNLEA